jgi:hypothetical protein
MRGRSAVTVDDVNLPVVPAGILPQQGAESLLRRCTCAKELKAINAVVWIDERLSRYGTYVGRNEGNTSTCRKKSGRDRDAELARSAVKRNQRPCHAALRC